MSISKTEYTIVNQLLDAADFSAAMRTIDSSNSQLYEFWSEEQPVLQGIKNLEKMTGGMFYYDYRGYAVWESRNYRSINSATPAATFNNTMYDLNYELSDKDIFNHITVKWTPTEPAGDPGGATDVTVKKSLYHRLYYGVKNTQTFYTNGDEEASSWQNVQAEVLRSLVDVTSGMTIYIDKETRTSCRIKYINNLYSDYPTVQINWLSVDYTPLQTPEDDGDLDTPSEVEVEDTTSIVAYGLRTKNIYIPFPMDREDALALANFYLQYYKDPVGLASMTLKNEGATNLLQQFSRRISDRVTCVCDRLGMTATDFFINKVDHKVSGNGYEITSVFHLEKAATQRQLWVLGISELGTDTRLAPG